MRDGNGVRAGLVEDSVVVGAPRASFFWLGAQSRRSTMLWWRGAVEEATARRASDIAFTSLPLYR